MKVCRIFFPIFFIASSVLGLDSFVCGSITRTIELPELPPYFCFEIWATEKQNNTYWQTDLHTINKVSYYSLSFVDNIPYYITISLVSEDQETSSTLSLKRPNNRSEFLIDNNTISINNNQLSQINFDIKKTTKNAKGKHNLIIKLESKYKLYSTTTIIPLEVQ